MIYPKDFETKIGFDAIRVKLAQLCTSRMAIKQVEKMTFCTDYKKIRHSLQSVFEMKSIREQGLPFPAIPTFDITFWLQEIRALNSFMSAERLYKVMIMLMSFAEINEFFKSQREAEDSSEKFSALQKDIENLVLFPAIISIITKAVNKYGELKDNASPALYEIRQSIKSANGSMQRAMRRVLDSAISSGIIDKDVAPAVRDGRIVIPVSAGNKRLINGIVHDESSTGKTVFIEPAEVVEAGNKLRELQLKEKREETAILIGIATEIRPHIDSILDSCRAVGLLEFIDAKAGFAIDVNASLPHIEDKSEIEWYHAVHPSLYMSLREQGRTVVPLNLTLSHDRRMLIISGPNAGGKSVTLKTIAVVQYMMQCGLLPTVYDNSHMGVFRNIFIDIGDEQSFENDLSTYSSHLRNMKFFLTHADKRTILLADEMGSGTEPQIGGAIAQAILQELSHTGCFGVITTHYQNLKRFADDTEGFVNGAMMYDRAKLQPTFQLTVGNAGSSFAIDIAHKMGLPLDIINNAKKIVGEGYVNFDKYLSDIARDRKYWANKRQGIREKENRLDHLLLKYEEVAGDLASQKKTILRDARKEAESILAETNARIERTILEIRKSQAEKEKTRLLRKELEEFKEATISDSSDKKDQGSPLMELKHKSKKSKQPAKKENEKPKELHKQLEVGDFVILDGGNTPGKLLSISGKKAEVAFGGLRTVVEISRLKYTKPPKVSSTSTQYTVSKSTSEESRERQLNFKTEIDVRGMRADEALQAVTYFIDDAIQFNAGKVRILHGTGHGILKTLIRQQLKATPGIDSFGDEDIRFGGAGITVVNLS